MSYERPRPPPALAPVGLGEDDPLFVDYASGWLEAKVEGLYCSRPIGEGTRKDYSWRLRRHLTPFFGGYRIAEIDRELCLSFKAHLLLSSRELREAIEAGAELATSSVAARCLSAPTRSESS